MKGNPMYVSAALILRGALDRRESLIKQKNSDVSKPVFMKNLDISISPLSMDTVMESLLSMKDLSSSQEKSVLVAIKELVYFAVINVEEQSMFDIYHKIFMAATNKEEYASLYHQIRKDAGL